MTEPNVLGNVSVGKFIFETGNTEIINLWKPNYGTKDESLFSPSAGTATGAVFVVPASHVFYLLEYCIDEISSGDINIDLMSNTSPDTATGGTTQARLSFDKDVDWAYHPRQLLIKFVAGEYITPIVTGGGDHWSNGWGVLCDA